MPAQSNNLIGAFIVGKLLAESAGLSSSQATQWGAVLMATGLSPASILLVSELARLDALRLSQQPNDQAQLRDIVQQAVQKAREAAENAARAAERTEQAITRLDQFNDRMAKLEAWVSQQSCTKETCEEILTALREIREYLEIGRNPLRRWCKSCKKICRRLFQPQLKDELTCKDGEPQ
jgi:acyl transferase domain-containing protein